MRVVLWGSSTCAGAGAFSWTQVLGPVVFALLAGGAGGGQTHGRACGFFLLWRSPKKREAAHCQTSLLWATDWLIPFFLTRLGGSVALDRSKLAVCPALGCTIFRTIIYPLKIGLDLAYPHRPSAVALYGRVGEPFWA